MTDGTAVPVLSVLAFLSNFGLSFLLAAVVDMIQLVTLHLRICHFVTAALTRFLLVGLGRLWDLFRGESCAVLI